MSTTTLGAVRGESVRGILRSITLDRFVLAWKWPEQEGRPCDMVEGFKTSPLAAYGLLADAQEAELAYIWIDEYDGLYRAKLTKLGQLRREALQA